MKNLSLLIKPASSLCNMHCKYCFYADIASSREIASYGIMSQETVYQILTTTKKDLLPGDHLTIAFQGGEPTLVGLDFFKGFFAIADDILRGIEVHYAFQTNGLLLDKNWCEVLLERKVLMGLSLDGPAGMHNAQRPDSVGKGTYNRVCASMGLLRRYGVPFNILAVLTSASAKHPSSFWNWLLKENVQYVQFIPCLNDLNASERSPYALTPTLFRDFYRQLFPMWVRSMEAGHFISVKFFDDLINLYLAGRTTACGITGHCTVQYVVEANGDVFPCDFYALDSYRMGSLLEGKPSDLFRKGEFFLTDGRVYFQTEPCNRCLYRTSCGGGCKRLKESMYLENGVCRYAELLSDILEPLLAFAQKYLTAHRN
ncbi:radical SAM protein [uncultured Oscillibacter sp.]|uniref:radical SAM/SPASM domain-containing protein n=1 Tax=uncultured Oscillibacter sp. TaxID=876091 RepID=UPI002604C00B|nr:radical SAM protein [uncultured Oscillibacter sp.]